MYSVMLKDGFSNARASARSRIENALDLNRLFRAIDADPAIVGAGVVYIDNQFNVVTLRDFQPICSLTVKRVILREAPRHMAPQQFAQELEGNPRESKIVFEAIGMGLSCVGAVIAWKVLGTVGAGLVPFTGGASTVIAYVGYAAAGATSLQCFNSFVRTGSEIAYPQLIDWADSKEWYQEVSLAVDAVSLLGGVATTLTTVRMIATVRSSTGKGLKDVLKGLSRQERVKLTDELLRIKDPRLTPKLIKLKKMTGQLPKRISAVQLRQDVFKQIHDSVGASLAVTGSAMSGSISAIAIGIYSEVAHE